MNRPPTSLRSTLTPWLLGTALLGVGVLVIALEAGGGAPQPSPAGLPDAGPLTGWGLPVVRLLVDLAGFGTVGLALVASRVVDVAPAAADEALPVAGRVAAVWAVLALLQSVLFMSEAQAIPLLTTDLESLGVLVTSLGDSPEAQAMLVQAALAASVVWSAGLSRTTRGAGVTLAVAVAAFVPLGLVGHSASGDRLVGFATLVPHVLAAALWVGGLAALGWAALQGRLPLANAVPRYSALALVCVVVVAVSGVLNAAVRVHSLDAVLTSAYGAILLAKVLALVVLTVFGHLHRQHTVERLRTWRRRRHVPTAAPVFVALAAVELVIMALTLALAVALARTPPPADQDVAGASTPAMSRSASASAR
jgi:putative copper export protein